MLKKKDGYSLVVLIIAITVIIILTTTAVISIKNIDKDKEVSKFMSDLQEVRQYTLEYFAKNSSLPILLNSNGEEENIEDSFYQLLKDNDSLSQINEDDIGGYYKVDLSKLGKIHLQDKDRGYILNQGTLNIYVENPFEYNGVKYYTITPELSGKDVVQYESVPFDVVIMGNPITWSEDAEILVSVTDISFSGDMDGWNFKWIQGSGDATTFKDGENINFFTYGETITLYENGIYTIYVESPEHKIVTRKIIISKIDDRLPTVKYNSGELFIDDAETGVKTIRYKIKETANHEISGEARENFKKYYTASGEEADDSLEEKLSKYLWGEENIKGETIEEYVKSYEEYTEKIKPYNDIINDVNSSSGEKENARASIKVVNESYPQFAYDNNPFSNTERNIVLYVEDMAGNQMVYSAVTRNELLNSRYVLVGGNSLTNAKIIINNNETYTNDGTLKLHLRARGARYVFITSERGALPTWKEFENDTETLTVSGDGEKIVYAFFKDMSGKIVSCFDKIILDQTPPSDTAPTVSGSLTNLEIVCNQTDSKIVDEVETQSGISEILYGIAKSTDESYNWYSSLDSIPNLTKGVEYRIVTKAKDKAGNEKISKALEVATDYFDNFAITINNGAMYTNSRDVNLKLKTQNSEQMFITETRNATPVWEPFNRNKTYQLSAGDGKKVVYAYYKLTTGIEEVQAEIILDTIEPTTAAPSIPNNLHNFNIVSNQTDTLSGIEKTLYGTRNNGATTYTWYENVSEVPRNFEEDTTYIYVTKAIDKAGNESISAEKEIKTGTKPLEDNIAVGDYIDIDFEEKTYTTNASATGSPSQNLQTNKDVNWQVLNIDQNTGEILIVSDGFANYDIRLAGIEGYMNGPRILDEICSTLYNSEELGIKARCIKLEDLNKALGVNPTSSGKYAFYPYNEYPGTGTYNSVYKNIRATNTDTRFYVSDSGGNEYTDTLNGFKYKKPTSTNPVCITQTYIRYDLPNTEIANKIKDLLRNKSGASTDFKESWGWTTTQANYVGEYPTDGSFVGYGLQAITTERVSYYSLYSTNGEDYAPENVGLRPIIVLDIDDLDIDINYLNQDGASAENAWNLTKK